MWPGRNKIRFIRRTLKLISKSKRGKFCSNVFESERNDGISCSIGGLVLERNRKKRQKGRAWGEDEDRWLELTEDRLTLA